MQKIHKHITSTYRIKYYHTYVVNDYVLSCVVIEKEDSGILKQFEQNKLNLSQCEITDEHIDKIIEALHNGVSLKECYITNASMSVTGASKLFMALIHVSSLEVFKINNINIGDDISDYIKVIDSKNCSLKELNISNNNIVATGAIVQLIHALSDTIEILDINNSFKKSNSDEIKDLTKALLGCRKLQELNISDNHLTFDNVLQIVQVLRGHPKLKILNLSGNITTYFLECEFLMDVILSVNHLLENVNVCGRNIRPRFNDDCLFSPFNNAKNSNRFALQNLYFTQHASINGLDSDPPTNYIETKEISPVPNESITRFYVDHSGGTFYNQNHNFAIVIPPGAVSDGECVEIQTNASWFNFYKIQKRYYFYKIQDGRCPISSFFWLSAHYTFKIPVYLILSHYAAIRSPQDIEYLSVLHGCVHDPSNSKEEPIMMKDVSSGFYFDDVIGYCIVPTKDFCSFCMTNSNTSIPKEFVIMKYTYNCEQEHFVEVCFCPAMRNCKQVISYVRIC